MGFPAYQPAPALPVQAPIDLAPLQKLLAAAPNRQGLAKTAAAQASQQVGAQLSAIQAAQQGELQQAAGRAREINAASLAGSHYLDSLGFAERLRAALQQAGQDQAAFAQGFSGDLRQTAEQDAAKVQQSLAAIGAPGQVPNADALANTVYGLGRIPADVLTASAPLVYAQAQTLPASLLAAGREQAVGALGAGQQAAAQYRPQIAAAIGSLPKLTQGILSDLTAAAEKARQDAIGNMFAAVKLQQDGRTEEATQAWRNAQIQGDQWKTYTAAYNHWADAQSTAAYRTAQLNKPHFFTAGGAGYSVDAKGNVTQITDKPPDISNTSGGGVYRTNPDGTITWLHQPSANQGTTSYDDAYGRRIRVNADGSQSVMSAGKFTDPATHRVYTVDLKGKMTPITKGSKPKAGGGLTANKRQELQTQAKQGAYLAAQGGETHTKSPDTDRVLTADPGDGQPWTQALQLADGTIYGYVNHLAPLTLGEALDRAARSGNPFAVKQVRLAYASADRARKLGRGAADAIAGAFGLAPP